MAFIFYYPAVLLAVIYENGLIVIILSIILSIFLRLNLNQNLIGNWDKFRIEQVFANLLVNAIKYGAGKPIQISLSREKDFAKLIVRDHGIGIAKENQNRIFLRFERVVSATEIRGLGLGLYIPSQIVEMHKGTITVDSELGK